MCGGACVSAFISMCVLGVLGVSVCVSVCVCVFVCVSCCLSVLADAEAGFRGMRVASKSPVPICKQN